MLVPKKSLGQNFLIDKNLFKFDAINITLGLKYIRMSPDHGTARDIIGKNLADNQSLIKCINFLDRLK